MFARVQLKITHNPLSNIRVVTTTRKSITNACHVGCVVGTTSNDGATKIRWVKFRAKDIGGWDYCGGSGALSIENILGSIPLPFAQKEKEDTNTYEKQGNNDADRLEQLIQIPIPTSHQFLCLQKYPPIPALPAIHFFLWATQG